jgi:hypothetical protein
MCSISFLFVSLLPPPWFFGFISGDGTRAKTVSTAMCTNTRKLQNCNSSNALIMKYDQDRLDQTMRLNSVRISGLPEDNQDDVQKIMEIGEKCDVHFEHGDIYMTASEVERRVISHANECVAS